MSPDKTLVDWAVHDLRRFNAAMCREEAAVVLAMWEQMVQLRKRSADAAAEVTELVLARFSPAEPPAVPGLDWLPSADEVASYTAAVAESLAGDAPVKELPAVAVLNEPKRRWVDSKGVLWKQRAKDSTQVMYAEREDDDTRFGVDLGYAIEHYGLVEVSA